MEQDKDTKKEPVKIELEIEELEAIVAPRLASNHNETLVRDF